MTRYLAIGLGLLAACATAEPDPCFFKTSQLPEPPWCMCAMRPTSGHIRCSGQEVAIICLCKKSADSPYENGTTYECRKAETEPAAQSDSTPDTM